MPLEQARRDHAAGLRTGTFISGYPGSPLAGLDIQLGRIKALLDQNDVRHVPAGNEEQAATALMGTQMLDAYPHERYDGVVGFWYGKGPGVDRSGDALKHGNFAGTSEQGAVVVLSGEDHEAKSSTMPFQQEYAFASAGIPVLYPGSVADIRRLGLHAVAMSRFSGCWVALKLVSQVCDGGGTIDLGVDVPIRVPELEIGGTAFEKRVDFSFFPGKNIDHERHLYVEKHAAVLAYARENGLNRCGPSDPGDTVGIVTAGKCAPEVRQALAELGLSPDREGTGVRLLDMGLIYPVDEELVREFARGLKRIIIVEEKREWLESAVRAAIQPLAEPIVVVGKRDVDGRELFPLYGGMDADLILERLHPLLTPLLPHSGKKGRLAELAVVRARVYEANAARTPNFCSGCPHSTSTVLAEGQVAWGSPGCGCFNTVIEQPHRHIDTMTQLGGEGLPWIGLAPFTDRRHMVQQVGDGSLYHSSYLNVRWAAAVGANLTFKVLYNGAVANTGAQAAVGSRGVLALTHGFASEGVARTIIVTKEPDRYTGKSLGARTEVRPVDELLDASRELERTPGTTVLLYDESCANERRRQQRRGKLAVPNKHLFINEAVCEACGDCGAKSNCMSLQHVETEFGPKTQIHASSCNDDYSCVQGDCPSFVTVTLEEGARLRRPTAPEISAEQLPAPAAARLDGPFHISMPGVGGTGVITVNAILAVAAQLDGLASLSYDQTGAAQKWGPVLSTLILLPNGTEPPSNRVGCGRADLLIALDEIGAASPANLDRCDPERTALVLNSDLFPTGEMIRDVDHVVDREGVRAALMRWTASDRRLEIPARTLAERCFGDYLLTNIIAIGAAVQAGWLPISPAAIEEAIRLNAVQVTANLAAFRVGRQWVADPGALGLALAPPHRTAEAEIERAVTELGNGRAVAYRALMREADQLPTEVRRLVAIRTAELIDYQSVDYARRYLRKVIAVNDAVQEVVDESRERFTAGVARNLFKLMAYKDEYEVARLHLHPRFARALAERFDGAIRVEYNLHPPLLRRLGRTKKISVGSGIEPAFRALRAMRRVRGTSLDPFGRTAARREERELIGWYEGLIDAVLAELSEDSLALALEAVELPDSIRGYEAIKSRSVQRARRRGNAIVRELRWPANELPMVTPMSGSTGSA